VLILLISYSINVVTPRAANNAASATGTGMVKPNPPRSTFTSNLRQAVDNSSQVEELSAQVRLLLPIV